MTDTMMTVLQCSMCKESKPTSDFHRDKAATSRDGFSYRCKPCGKNQARMWYQENTTQAKASRADYARRHFVTQQEFLLLRKYGITKAEYGEIVDRQGGGCAICGGQEPIVNRSLAVDHDHATGEVRGVLCSSCNRGVGLLGDDHDRMLAAATYLLAHRNVLESL